MAWPTFTLLLWDVETTAEENTLKEQKYTLLQERKIQ